MMRTKQIVVVMVLALGCGGVTTGVDAGHERDAGRDAGSPAADAGRDAGSTDPDAGTDAGASDAGTDAAMTVDASATRITLSDVGVYANCMPIVAPDPIIAFWNVTVTGAPASSATLTRAELRITGASTVTQLLTVDSPTVALAGGTGTAMQRKTGADANPGSACGELCSGATFTLTLTFDVGGTSIEVVEGGSFGCVY